MPRRKKCAQCGIVHDPCPSCRGVIHVGDWPFCGGDSAKHQSVLRRYSSIEPVLIFRARNGQIRIPGSNTARTPPGYERVEIRDIQTLSKFESRYREQLRSESSAYRAAHDAAFADYAKRQRSDLRQAMQRMNPFGRALAELAMRRNDERSSRSRGGDFTAGFDVLNYDQSSREAHRDESTGWRPKQV